MATHDTVQTSILTLSSMMVLIGVEVFAVAIAGGWAVAGLFELGDHVGYALMVAFSLVGVWLMRQLWRRARTQSVLRRRAA